MTHNNECTSPAQKTQETQIFHTKPADFSPAVEVAAVYVEVNGQVLLLQNGVHKKEGNAWGVPAGKIEAGETPLQGARRELFEEAGIEISHDCALNSLGQLYIRKPFVEYVYHGFGLKLADFPTVIISDEHQNYKWVTKKEALKLNLMDAAESALDFYFNNEAP